MLHDGNRRIHVMKTRIPDTEAEILQLAREFSDARIRPYAASFDERGALPSELVEDFGGLGFLAARIPKKYGGLDLSPLTYGLLTEIVGRACSSTRALLTVHSSLVGETLLRWGNPQQKDRWLPGIAAGKSLWAFALTEPEAGSDARMLRTTFRRVGDRYELNGQKKWISFGAIANMLLVFAASERGIGAFLVDRSLPGINVTPMGAILSHRATHLAEISFRDVAVPLDAILGSEDGAGHFILPVALDHGRYSIAWAGAAIAGEALSEMVSYAGQRRQFGEKIGSFQLIAGMIGDATTQVHAARALCMRAAELRASKAPSAAAETMMAKYFASKAAARIASDAVQVHGANGLDENYAVQRLFRDAKALEIIEGSSQIQQLMISEYALTQMRACTEVAVSNPLGVA
jgi:alkylation response protein AidB-like acyl-CoA dehydrogenase